MAKSKVIAEYPHTRKIALIAFSAHDETESVHAIVSTLS